MMIQKYLRFVAEQSAVVAVYLAMALVVAHIRGVPVSVPDMLRAVAILGLSALLGLAIYRVKGKS